MRSFQALYHQPRWLSVNHVVIIDNIFPSHIDVEMRISMTASIHCEKCLRRSGILNLSPTSDFTEIGMKNTCCRKCSNPQCKDYGICECFETFMDANRERVKELFMKTHLGNKESEGVE
jgi:hypothetical protein